MSNTVEDIRCNRCSGTVHGYEHRVRFTFEDGERLQVGSYAALSCGCEILDYDLLVENDLPGEPTRMIDDLRKDTVLTFNDAGPHNDNWHRELKEEEEW